MKSFKDYSFEKNQLVQRIEELPNLPRSEIQNMITSHSMADRVKSFMLRGDFVKKYAWSLPCKEAIDAIIRWARPPLFDIMSGSGYWAKILNDRGISTFASDINTYKNNYGHRPFIKVRRKNAYSVLNSTIPRFKKRFGATGDILLAWPPYGKPIGNNVVNMLESGTRVFYFGEAYGCTGCEKMQETLDEKYNLLQTVLLPQWEGLHDKLFIYEKI